jgi:hypothetical protein
MAIERMRPHYDAAESRFELRRGEIVIHRCWGSYADDLAEAFGLKEFDPSQFIDPDAPAMD